MRHALRRSTCRPIRGGSGLLVMLPPPMKELCSCICFLLPPCSSPVRAQSMMQLSRSAGACQAVKHPFSCCMLAKGRAMSEVCLLWSGSWTLAAAPAFSPPWPPTWWGPPLQTCSHIALATAPTHQQQFAVLELLLWVFRICPTMLSVNRGSNWASSEAL